MLAQQPRTADPVSTVHQLMQGLLAENPEGYTNPLLADKIVATLREENPQLLNAYLHARATYLITLELGTINRADRHYRQANASRSAFADAVEAYETQGNRLLLAKFTVDAKGSVKQTADMVADDHRFVAKGYQESAKTASFRARFHETVAHKLGNRTTGEAFNEESYRALYNQFAQQRERQVL